jgi:hypothetical protein
MKLPVGHSHPVRFGITDLEIHWSGARPAATNPARGAVVS